VLDLREETEGVSAVFNYATDLFKGETVRNWTEVFKCILTNEESLCLQEKPCLQEPASDVLLDVWKTVLGTDTDDFFEAGGTSLSAIRLESALYEKGWLLSAADIFHTPKLLDMAALLTPVDEIDWEDDF